MAPPGPLEIPSQSHCSLARAQCGDKQRAAGDSEHFLRGMAGPALQQAPSAWFLQSAKRTNAHATLLLLPLPLVLFGISTPSLYFRAPARQPAPLTLRLPESGAHHQSQLQPSSSTSYSVYKLTKKNEVSSSQPANMHQSISRALLIVASAAALFASGSAANGIAAEEPYHLRKLQTYTASDNYQSAMLQAVNAERAKQGLVPFCTNKKLQAAAQLHSEDQAKNNFMSHTGSNGSQMSARITAQGFVWSSIAENVAAGQVDVASVVKSWMASEGHRANILGDYKFFGMGYAYNAASTYKYYWTQDFGTGANEVCDSDGTVTQTATPTPAPTTATPVVQLTTTTAVQQTTTTTTTPTPTTTAPASGTSMQVQMLNAVNAERAAQGLAPFCTNKKLQAAAQLHSEDQATNNFMSHTGSNGSQMSARITAQGFVWTGIAENVAAGQVDVASVVKSWMASSGHRANILGNYKYFGMGYAYNAKSTYKHYWTQDFGTGSKEVCDSDGTATQTAAPVVTPAPTTAAPATPTLTTPKPTTAAPVTPAPTTPKPTTATPVTQQTTAPAATTATPASGTSMQVQMLNAVNAERAAQGLSPFCTNKKLQAAAQLHSEDQAKNNFMSHTGSNGSQMSARITAQGFVCSSIAENVAAGQIDVASVVKSWMASEGHRANILGDYKFFGMGYAYNAASTYKYYWTQDFGTGAKETCD